MGRTPLLLGLGLLLLALACTSETAGKDNKPTPGGDGGSGDSGEEGGGGEDGGASDSGLSWEPAPIRPGAYTMTITTLTTDTCSGGRLAVGDVQEAPAPSDGTYTRMWEYVALEARGSELRGSGTTELRPNPDLDCIITQETSVTGHIISQIEFGLDVSTAATGTGADCGSLPSPLPCEQVFGATFVFINPTEDTAAPPPSAP